MSSKRTTRSASGLLPPPRVQLNVSAVRSRVVKSAASALVPVTGSFVTPARAARPLLSTVGVKLPDRWNGVKLPTGRPTVEQLVKRQFAPAVAEALVKELDQSAKAVRKWVVANEPGVVAQKACRSLVSAHCMKTKVVPGPLVAAKFQLKEEGTFSPNCAVCLPFKGVTYDSETRERLSGSGNFMFDEMCASEPPQHLLGPTLQEVGATIIGLQFWTYLHTSVKQKRTEHIHKVHIQFRLHILIPTNDGGPPVEVYRVKGRSNRTWLDMAAAAAALAEVSASGSAA